MKVAAELRVIPDMAFLSCGGCSHCCQVARRVLVASAMQSGLLHIRLQVDVFMLVSLQVLVIVALLGEYSNSVDVEGFQ
jgi:hypothetical protein